jgi:hypothetical protein
MEDLFRFAQIRRPHRLAHEVGSIALGSGSDFQTSLSHTQAAERVKRREMAEAFAKTDGFVKAGAGSAFLEKLEKVAAEVDPVLSAANGSLTPGDLDTILTEALEQNAAAFMGDAETKKQVIAIKDSIVAIKIAPSLHGHPIARLVDALRVAEIVRQRSEDDDFPNDRDQLLAARRRSVIFPDGILHPKIRPERATPESVPDRLRKLAENYSKVDAAIAELSTVRPGAFEAKPGQRSPERLPPEKFRPDKLFEGELEIRQKVLAATLGAAGATIVSHDSDMAKLSGAMPAVVAASGSVGLEHLSREGASLKFSKNARLALMGRPEFTAAASDPVLKLSAEAAEKLSATTKLALKERKIETGQTLSSTVETLLAERKSIHETAQLMIQPLVPQSFRRVGNTLVALSNTLLAEILHADPGRLADIAEHQLPALTESVPTSHADITPAGVMDLLIVRQQLKGYETADISHIENVLSGEKRERFHSKRLETETTIVRESERETSSEEELQTTDRFEMRRESQRALEEQAAARGSLTISGSYGPSVDFTASGEASWSRREQQASSSASEVSREVTQRATERVVERVLRRETTRTLLQIEETNRHGFDNSTPGSDPVVGIYQFVNKVYEAQVYNYGQRAIYDLVVPEPGALLLAAFQRNRAEAIELIEPLPFTVEPRALKPDTYQSYLVRYQATGIKPPPLPFMTETYDFNTGGEDKDQEFTCSTRIQIPDGYEAYQASVGITVAIWDSWCVDTVVGRQPYRFESGTGWTWLTNLSGETGSVPFAMCTDRVGDIALAVEIICKATPRAVELWQAETHALLVDAYRARQSEYEAKLAALEAEAPLAVASRSAARNYELMATEMKRACISILTEQEFGLFSSMGTGADGLPSINFPEASAEGAYARFFEQAFEWSNMSWVTYAYFWGRRSRWADLLSIQDGDWAFEEFLRAGAARVVVPVRPGFEAAVDHFRLFGEPWFGGPLPTVTDDLYLPIGDEMAERLGRPGNEVTSGDPWDVRVPTDLIKLREDGSLPAWTKQADGSWTPA